MRGELEDFAAEMFDPFARNDQRRWGQVYLRGLLTDGKRKSVEPMAVRLGEDGNRQALAHFVTTSPWDPSQSAVREVMPVSGLELGEGPWSVGWGGGQVRG